MRRYKLSPDAVLILQRGDITRVAVDAIVNAANPALLGGAGVDGAIHRAAGPELLAACRALPAEGRVRCPTGEARITPGFRLPAPWVIHTVGPIYDRHPDPHEALASAHRASLTMAVAHGIESIAFPALSCGVYGFPLDEAAEVAIETVKLYHSGLREVRFVLFGDDAWGAWRAEADASLRALPGLV
jgi:O-acetyl-ADP-ribose deacetylase (regulator of RNase III)